MKERNLIQPCIHHDMKVNLRKTPFRNIPRVYLTFSIPYLEPPLIPNQLNRPSFENNYTGILFLRHFFLLG